MIIHNIFIHNSQDVGTDVYQLENGLTIVYLYKENLLSNKKRQIVDNATICKKLKKKYAE